jgi:Spy/CpxP family protein refolding chaperone
MVSIGFNVFFITGYYHARATLRELRSDEGRVRLIARQLNLTKQQEEQFLRLRAELKKETDRYDKENAAEIDAFWEEMSKDQPDFAKIKGMLRASFEKKNELRLVMVEYMYKAFPILTSEQRKALATMIRERSFFRQL